MTDTFDMLARFQRHPEAFVKATTPEEFITLIKGNDAKVLPLYLQKDNSWTRYLWRTAKAHGLKDCPHQVLYMPEAKALSEIITDVRFLPLPTGGKTRDETRRQVENRIFISGLRARDSVPFDSVGGKRDWSPDWLARGEKVRRHMGGTSYGTYAYPTAAANAAFNSIIGGRIGGLELIAWDNGRTLCIARDNDGGIFTLWMALLSPGQADARQLMPEADQRLIAENKQAEREAWGDATND